MPRIVGCYVIYWTLEQVWKVFTNPEEHFPEIMPHLFAKVERLEGDGGVGTVRVYTLGDGMGSEAGKLLKERIEEFHESEHQIVTRGVEGSDVVGDPRFKIPETTIGMVDGSEHKFTLFFRIVSCVSPPIDTLPPPVHLKSFGDLMINSINQFALQNPNYANE